MNFLNNSEMSALGDDERDHLTRLEEAIQDALLASAVTAKANQLDVDLIARATLPLVLSVVAREYLTTCEQHESEPTLAEFRQLSEGAYLWSIKRGNGTEKTHH